MIRWLFRLTAGWLLLAGGLLPAVGRADPAEALPNLPFLFAVRASVDAEPSYLLGSIHVSNSRVSEYVASIDSLIAESDLLATEIDLSPQGFQLMMRAMTADPAKGSVFKRMPEDLRERAETFFGQLLPNIPATFYSAFEPWALFLTASVAELESLNLGQAMDLQLHFRAKTHGVPTTGIETIDQHLAAFRKMSEAECWDALDATIDALESDELDLADALNRLLEAYYAGDGEALLEVGLTEFGAIPELSDLETRLMYGLLNVRNRGMADWIAKRLAEAPGERTVVAVGALHLVGDENVPELLRERGLIVERIIAEPVLAEETD